MRNKALKVELDNLIQTWGQDTRNTIQKLDPELEQTRKYADDLSEGVAKAHVRAKRLDYDIAKLYRQYESEAYASAEDSEKIKSLQYLLEQTIHELESFKKLIDEKKAEIKETISNNSKLNDQIENLLNKLDEQNVKCLQLRNVNQTLEEQIPFLKAVHEKEIIEMKRLFDNRRIDTTQFYTRELHRAIEDIRNDFRQLNEIEKQELDDWYRIKSAEIRALGEKHANNDMLPNILLTNRSLKETYEMNTKQTLTLEGNQKDLEKRLRDLEDQLEEKRRDHLFMMEKQDGTIAQKKNEIQTCLNDYDHLLHTKDVIEFEINIYKRILDSRCVTSVPKKDISKDDLFLRLEREKAKFHDPHVSIAWSNVNDLDLHVVEPSGEEISFSHRKSASGGNLDVDMNAGSQRSTEPCENVYWPVGSAPLGHYKVLVVYYSNHGSKDPTDYLLVARILGKEFEFQGRISFGDSAHVYEFDI